MVPATGDGDVTVEGTAVQPPASHPCVRGEGMSRGVSPQGEGPRAVSPSGAPASCSNAFCHRVPLWQSCKAAEPSAPLCKDGYLALFTALVLSFLPSVPISPRPPRKETAARAPQIFIRRGQCCRVVLALQGRGGDAVTCSEVS